MDKKSLTIEFLKKIESNWPNWKTIRILLEDNYFSQDQEDRIIELFWECLENIRKDYENTLVTEYELSINRPFYKLISIE